MKKVIISIVLVVSFMGLHPLTAQETLNVEVDTYELLKSLSQSKLADGHILLFNTTHEDIAWLDEPEICKIDRDEKWLTPYIEKLREAPDFKMDIEQSSIVMEYLHRHPEEREAFIDFIDQGRIGIGGAYVQAYEGMYSGESLARQFYWGAKWMEDNLNGYQASTYYNVDVPGRTMQMPQLAKKAGVENFVFSRHIKGLFYWESPDGSRVTCYSPGNHYMDFYNLLGMQDEEGIQKMARDAVDWYTLYNNLPTKNPVMPVMLNYEFIWDQTPVENLEPFIKKWNGIQYITAAGRKKIKINLPKIIHSTADEFFEKVEKTTLPEKVIKGERPNMWVYIHGASHQQALKASREGDILLTQAEKFATINALLDGSFDKYPAEKLKRAWEAKIYPDHGWGGKGGDVTDRTFLQKFIYARSEANSVLESSITDIAGRIEHGDQKGIPIVVFNSLSWNRSGIVNFDIKFDQAKAYGFKLFNSLNKAIPFQKSHVERYPDNSIKSVRINFEAQKVPSIGFETFYMELSEDERSIVSTDFDNTIENAYYRLRFGDGGLEGIFDKELGVELIDSRKFKAGEIFALNSVGNGAGEFSEVQQPDTKFFDRLSTSKTKWSIQEEGPVFTSIVMRQPMQDAIVEMKVKLYHTTKKIDFDVDLLNWNGTMFREFRIAFPLDLDNGKVTYEVPFGAVTVGEDELEGTGGEFYKGEVNKIRPRAIGNWISASDSDYGVTIASSVVTADWQDPTDSLSQKTILQPILLASRKSCHHEGNDYHQTGDHSFSFSLTSHKPGWRNGRQFGTAHNEKFQKVVDPVRYRIGVLPNKQSFFSVSDSNLVISTLKKAEDDNKVVMRIFEADGQDSEAKINVFNTVDRAWRTSLIEKTESELRAKDNTISIEVGHNAIETLKFK
ncbi:glycoside hydrolase family 38 N-terminal domain-containing protein [Aestuariivivens insulae]|uniref:glycoside hydrolase family 38 N-terminal domain-containing protein n=1 Tax=Aestuariivivens insulae TaxID=1621988 RepID=UPI001F5699AE|nr:glycoside hydrolase family 38 C-terminal domain-containing protein [Aestuariivivens insulae]